MVKKIIKRTTGIVTMIVALAAFVVFMQDYFCMRPDIDQIRLTSYYVEEKNSLDVVLMGSSEIYNGFSSAEMYRLTGVTSYPYAFQANPVRFWKYELREIERTQNPKVLVIEPNGVKYSGTIMHDEKYVRIIGDAMPMSKNKVDFVNDCASCGADSKLSYYIPFLKYHGEWGHAQSLSVPRMRMRGYAVLRGAFSHYSVASVMAERDVTGDYSTIPLDANTEVYVREFLDEAKASGIEHIVFVRFPHKVIDGSTYGAYQRGNAFYKIATEEYGFDYIDLMSCVDEMGLTDQDWSDSEHLNARGQRKLTAYLGQQLCDKYNLQPSQLTDKQKAGWDESALYIEYFYKRFETYLVEHKEDFEKYSKRRHLGFEQEDEQKRLDVKWIQVEDDEVISDIERMIQEDQGKSGASTSD